MFSSLIKEPVNQEGKEISVNGYLFCMGPVNDLLWDNKLLYDKTSEKLD